MRHKPEILKSGVQPLMEFGIRGCGIRNTRTLNPESTAWNPESKTLLDYITWGEHSPCCKGNVNQTRSRSDTSCNATIAFSRHWKGSRGYSWNCPFTTWLKKFVPLSAAIIRCLTFYCQGACQFVHSNGALFRLIRTQILCTYLTQ